MANFKSYQDFFGTYTGSYDGRNARLEITDIKADSVRPVLHIKFTDLDRNEVYQVTHFFDNPKAHILQNITLKQTGRSNSIVWKEVLLHTWSTNFLSGISVWNGIDFGMSFKKG
jgi:hypothetical protein